MSIFSSFIKSILDFKASVKPISAKNLRDVHQSLEKGKTIGKIVLADWN